MKTHPRIAAILKRTNLTPDYRRSVELADMADKKHRSYWGHNNAHKHQSLSDMIASMHSELLKLGIETIAEQEVDVWLLRCFRQLQTCNDLEE
jgi:hypothetical protein